MTRAAALAALLVAACYDPSYQDLACGTGGACPTGFVCGADNVCARDVAIDAAVIDGPPGEDASDAPIDASEPPIDAPPASPCPIGWTMSPSDPSRCFRYFSKAASWSIARDLCANIGARLADVRTLSENLALIELAGSPRQWLGGTDVAAESTWIWTTINTPFTFRSWGEAQPSADPSKNCAAFCGNNAPGFGPGDWMAESCGLGLPYVCVRAP